MCASISDEMEARFFAAMRKNRTSGGESHPPQVRRPERFGPLAQNLGALPPQRRFGAQPPGGRRLARRWRNSFLPSISNLWGPQKGRMERPFGGRGRRGSNSLPASREWPEVHSQEPCRTSDQTCLRHRWRQRVRSSADEKRTSRLGCPLEVGAGDEARTRYLHLGKVALYQMSYARRTMVIIAGVFHFVNRFLKNLRFFFSRLTAQS